MTATDLSHGTAILEIDDMSAEEWFAYAEDHGWGDGLPTLVPTVDAIERFLVAAGLASKEAQYKAMDGIGIIPPRRVVPTVASLAASAYMAGCTPGTFEVFLGALRGCLEEKFNLYGTLATTHPCTPLVIVNGGVRQREGFVSAGNCFGPGGRANATVGRAIHLVMITVGGLVSGLLDRATQGSPAKYSWCFAENEERSPWEPLSVRRGFAPGEDVVSVISSEPPHNINDHGSTSGDEIITTIAGVISELGSNTLYLTGEHILVLGPEHAATMARDHWTIPSIQEALFERSRVPVSHITKANQKYFAQVGKDPIGGYYTVNDSAEMIQIMVAGGEGKHSAWIPTFGDTRLMSISLEAHRVAA